MWIVRLALRRPYTFIVVSMLILIVGVVSILRTPTDIFPNIDIPVVSSIWNYTGLSPSDMTNRIVSGYERGLTTTVSNIEHIESQSYTGIAVVKLYLQPGASVATAMAQLAAIGPSSVRQDPPGTIPPFLIAYNASTVPILQLALTSDHLGEQQIYDMGNNFIRNGLATIPGVAIPNVYGGKQRQVEVDLNIAELQAKGLSANDVVNAVGAQNIILPTGTAKIGPFEYLIETNGSPRTVNELNDLPVRTTGSTTTYVRDVAFVRDGSPPQTNIVRVNGKRAVLQTILKSGDTSTVAIISDVKKKLPGILADLPEKPDVRLLSDQSIFVKASIVGVVREGTIAAVLTGLMIFLFLGSWRSTLIIAISIPLSVLTSLIVLSALGETINIMTLGGLALAVGILVDDATVEVENINRNIEQDKEIIQAILDGASQIAVPALVSTLSICIVFVPMFFLSGVAKYLFVPLAEAVSFAMLASYLLSRTLVPTMARYLLVAHTAGEQHEQRSGNPFIRIQQGFERGFESIRLRYQGLLEKAISHRKLFVTCFLAACVLSFALLPFVGEDFFPSVDSGEFKIHLRAPTGTRIEETAALCDRVDSEIRREIPPSELETIIDNVGMPYSGINLSYSTSAPIGPGDADIQVELNEKHRPVKEYIRMLRAQLPQDFPGVSFYNLPVDIVTQILNFGLPAPIDIQIVGNKLERNRLFAEKLFNDLKFIPGAVDLRIQQPFNYPNFYIDVDRTKAQEIGYSETNIASNLLVSLSGSFQTAPSFWLDPQNGISYSVQTQTPQYRISSLQDLQNIPITNGVTASAPEILANVASIKLGGEMATISHYDTDPVIDIYGAVDGRDLGGVSSDISSVVERETKNLPEGSRLVVRGQIQTMNDSFVGLLAGLAFSILLVYFLIVMNFQSWLDPFVILMALPAALAGIVWMLFVTGTTISVPALTGAIMCMGVGARRTAFWWINFSKERLEAGENADWRSGTGSGFHEISPGSHDRSRDDHRDASHVAGVFGEGGEQNAPLGRAVIGGLLFATVATLFFVPVFFSFIHGLGDRQSSSIPE